MTEAQPAPDSGSADVRVVWTTAPDPDTAARLARGLVEARLAACVQVLPGVRSFYRWQGELHAEPETLLIAKTRASRGPELESWLAEPHPYDVPECVSFAPERVAGDYARWLAGELPPRS